MKFFNERRLRDYPKLFLITLWGVMLINVVFHRGWVGRFGGIIGVDFLAFYSSGLLYRTSIANLYHIDAQAQIQQALVSPTPLNGTVNIFTYPPYAASFFSLYTLLPLIPSFSLYLVVLIMAASISVYLSYKYLVPDILRKHLSPVQLGIVLFSSLPFILGIFFGQNSSLTLLLLTLIVIASFKEKWLLAGIFAGCLLYKPHYVLGFLILWLAWKRIDALLGFGLVSFAWIGVTIGRYGLSPFTTYLSVLNQFMNFPYAEGLKLDLTPYAFILSLVPPEQAGWVKIVNYGFVFLCCLALFLYARRSSHPANAEQIPPVTLALFLPFLISPHSLIYDLLPIFLILILWSKIDPSRQLLRLAIFSYFGAMLIPGLTRLIPLHLLVIIPLALVGFFIRALNKQPSPEQWLRITP